MIATVINPNQAEEKLSARDRELRDLLDLLIVERIVLLYAPPGAGKSSLIHTSLTGELRKEGFSPLPVIRVGLRPEGMPRGANRYLMSAKLSLERRGAEGVNDRQCGQPLEELAAMSLVQYLDQRPGHFEGLNDDQEEEVLIFDQFEEVLTPDPADKANKLEFFRQVGAALRNHNRWALFVLREEYRAALDPYLRYIPNGLSATFRLESFRGQ